MTRRATNRTGEVLDLRALNRAYMARQLLIRRSPMPVAEAIEHLVGLQGQVPLVPYTSLWSRLEGWDPMELGRMIEERTVVRTSLMRSTIHMVTARDALFLRPLMQPVLERVYKGSSPFGRAVAGVDEAALLAAGRDLLEAKPLTRARLSAELAERFPGYDPLSLAYTITYQMPLVQVPPRGVWGRKSIQATWTTLSSWLETPLGTATPEAHETMVLRYLAAFGPATIMDIQSWCWLTKLGAVVEGLRPRLRTFRDEQGRELFDVPDGPHPDPETPIPPRFLGEYDNLFLSHADRSRVGALDIADRNFRKGPFFVDGFGHGCWDLIRDGRRATLDRGAVPAAGAGRPAGRRRGGRAAAGLPGRGLGAARRAIRGRVRLADAVSRPSGGCYGRAMRGDRVEIVVDTGQGVQTFDIVATKNGRRLEVTTARGVVEVTEVTRGGTPVRTGRFMASRLIALVEHPAQESSDGRVDVTTRRRMRPPEVG